MAPPIIYTHVHTEIYIINVLYTEMQESKSTQYTRMESISCLKGVPQIA